MNKQPQYVTPHEITNKEKDDMDERKIQKNKEMHFRRKQRQLIRFKRELEAQETGAGGLARAAVVEAERRILLPDTMLNTIRTMLTATLIDVIYVTFMCGYSPTPCANEFLVSISDDKRILYFLYFGPTLLHLGLIALVFSQISKKKVLATVLVGVLCILWHVIIIFMYFTMEVANDYPAENTYLYALELIPCFVLVVSSIFLLLKVNYVQFDEDEIDRVITQQEVSKRIEDRENDEYHEQRRKSSRRKKQQKKEMEEDVHSISVEDSPREDRDMTQGNMLPGEVNQSDEDLDMEIDVSNNPRDYEQSESIASSQLHKEKKKKKVQPRDTSYSMYSQEGSEMGKTYQSGTHVTSNYSESDGASTPGNYSRFEEDSSRLSRISEVNDESEYSREAPKKRRNKH